MDHDRHGVGPCPEPVGGVSTTLAVPVGVDSGPDLVQGIDRARGHLLVVRSPGRRCRARRVVDMSRIRRVGFQPPNVDADGGPGPMAHHDGVTVDSIAQRHAARKRDEMTACDFGPLMMVLLVGNRRPREGHGQAEADGHRNQNISCPMEHA